MHYRREIDGLRAVAVMPVVLFHAHLPFFGGGFVGVDVFFVISGYLITSILLEQIDKGTYSLAQFYERRARRIVPAFVGMMLLCLPISYVLMHPVEFREFLNSFLYSAVGLSNFYFMEQVGYFAPDADLQPLLHTWSLGVEEQYYLVFPLLLAYLTARMGASRTKYLVGLTVAGFAFAEVARHFDAERSFFFTLSRTWELGMGSLCAVFVKDRSLRPSNLLALTGILLISFSIFVYDRAVPFPSVYALAPVVGTCLIILFAQEKTWVGQALATKPLVGIGLISYSTYLWHQPIFAFARLLSTEHLSHIHMVGLSAGALVAGWISWRWMEQPFRRQGHLLLPGRRQMLGTSAAAITVLLALGGFGITFKEYGREVWLRFNPDVAASYLLSEKAKAAPKFKPDDRHDGAQSASDCRFNIEDLDNDASKRLNDCHRKYGPGVMIIGDSHSIDFFGVITSRFSSPFVVGVTKGGCRAHDPEPDCQFDQVFDYLATSKDSLKLVIYTQAGFYLLKSEDGDLVTRKFFNERAMTEKVPPTRPNEERIEAILAYLEKLSRFTKVKWIGPRTEPHIPFNHFARAGCDASFTLRPGQSEAFATLDAFIAERVANSGKILYLSQIDMMHFNWAADYSDCKDLFFVDGDHYSAAGEVRFGRNLPSNLLN